MWSWPYTFGTVVQVPAPGRQLLGRFRQILDAGIEDIIANHALDMQQSISTG